MKSARKHANHEATQYCTARKAQSRKDAARIPLPDFFIGAHAEVMGWTVITNDTGRLRTYLYAVMVGSIVLVVLNYLFLP